MVQLSVSAVSTFGWSYEGARANHKNRRGSITLDRHRAVGEGGGRGGGGGVGKSASLTFCTMWKKGELSWMDQTGENGLVTVSPFSDERKSGEVAVIG